MPELGSVLIPIVLIGWMIYRRIRRTIGFQPLARGRLIYRCIAFAVAGALILSFAFQHPIQLIGDVIGAIGGGVLAYFAIRHLKFEQREERWYYRTHIWVETTVLVLFFGRIAYRLLEVFKLSSAGLPPEAANPNAFADFSRDPLTTAVLFLIITYYMAFFIYLLNKSKTLTPTSAAL